METTVYDNFLGTLFESLRFRLSALKTERFQNYAFIQRALLLKPFPKSPFSSDLSGFCLRNLSPKIDRHFLLKINSLF